MATRMKQAHNHDPAQLPLTGVTQTRAVARRTDPETSHEAARSVKNLRSSHLYVLQLFRTYGAMSDAQAWEVHSSLADERSNPVPRLSPSGLRSRRAELCPPRGAGIRDSGRRVTSAFGQKAVVWEIDPDVTEPFGMRSSRTPV